MRSLIRSKFPGNVSLFPMQSYASHNHCDTFQFSVSSVQVSHANALYQLFVKILNKRRGYLKCSDSVVSMCNSSHNRISTVYQILFQVAIFHLTHFKGCELWDYLAWLSLLDIKACCVFCCT